MTNFININYSEWFKKILEESIMVGETPPTHPNKAKVIDFTCVFLNPLDPTRYVC